MNPDEFMAKLQALFSSMGGGPEEKRLKSNNPAKYPRSVRLNPSEAKTPEKRDEIDKMLMLLTEIEMKRKKVESLWEEAQIYMQEGSLARTRFFRMAGQVFPEVATKGKTEVGAGWREWKGEYWLVAWDSEEADEEQNGTTDAPGLYL